MSALVIAEHDGQTLKSATLATITAATQLSNAVTVLLLCPRAASVATQAANVAGVTQVVVLEIDSFATCTAEQIAPLLVEQAAAHQHILAPATTFGKNVLPRVAAALDNGLISDVIAIINPTTFVRPIYAGNALATVQNAYPRNILTIRTTAFTNAVIDNHAAPITSQAVVLPAARSRYLGAQLSDRSRPELAQARVVISGGRALQSKENFKLLEVIADKLHAAVGASRAAVDAGYVPNDYQVGQTGKVIAPELYIAVGISGAIQHLAGMKDSKIIVAINKDADAPIFKIANYGVVGDLFEILPQLTAAIDKLAQ